MRRMKDSGIAWIGEIPAGWEIKRLKFICTINPRVNIDDINLETEVSFLPMENIKYGYFVNTIIKKISEYCLSYNIFNNGDILLAKVTPCFENGNIAIANNLKNCIGFGTSEIFVVRVINSDNKFLFYYFRNELFRQRAIATMSGTGGLKRISPQFMRDENILFPPLPEQHRIAAYLDAKCAEIDRSMELVRQSMDKLKAYKMSVITEAVTRGLDHDVPMRDSGVPWIGEIPEGWEIIRLKFIAPVQGGYSFKAEKFSTEHGIPLVRMNNLKRGTLNLEDAVKIQEEDIIEEFFINENDILIGLSGSLGDTGSLGNYAVASKGDLPCLLNQRVGRFTVSKSIKYKLIVYFLDTDFFKQPLILDSNGTAQFNISPYDIGEVLVPLPPRSEQQDIIAYLDAKCAEIDAIIAQKQELLDKLAAYKKSLIFECVTGKREVAA